MASTDRELQKMGDAEARRYLGEETVLENVDEEQILLKVTHNRTILNKKALMKDNGTNANEMSQGIKKAMNQFNVVIYNDRFQLLLESFMEEVSKDAEKRYKDKLVRTEKMETFKKQATLAFRRGEYERALVLYNKVRSFCTSFPKKAKLWKLHSN